MERKIQRILDMDERKNDPQSVWLSDGFVKNDSRIMRTA